MNPCRGSAGGSSREAATGRGADFGGSANRNSARQAANSCSGRAASAEMMEASTGAVPTAAESAVMTTGPDCYYNADDRGPSEISRELR